MIKLSRVKFLYDIRIPFIRACRAIAIAKPIETRLDETWPDFHRVEIELGAV